MWTINIGRLTRGTHTDTPNETLPRPPKHSPKTGTAVDRVFTQRKRYTTTGLTDSNLTTIRRLEDTVDVNKQNNSEHQADPWINHRGLLHHRNIQEQTNKTVTNHCLQPQVVEELERAAFACVCLSVCLYLCLSVSVFVSVCVCVCVCVFVSVWWFPCWFVGLLVCWFVCVRVRLSVCLFGCLC